MFYQYCRELGFNQDPDYSYLHRLLKEMIILESFTHVLAFEWLTKNKGRL
jgi:hypothetical protein